MKINKTHEVKNSLHPKKTDKPYDVVMVYCRYCKQKIDVRVYHSLAQLEYYQIVNLPEKITKHLDTREIYCSPCDKTFILEKETKDSTTDYHLKLDCSNIGLGMEAWYEDAIPNMSGDEYQ